MGLDGGEIPTSKSSGYFRYIEQHKDSEDLCWEKQIILYDWSKDICCGVIEVTAGLLCKLEYCGELWMLGCEAFGFNLLGKEEWLGWLICQQDIEWLNQGEREEAGRAFVKGMIDFVLCICISKEIPNCILKLKNILQFSIVTNSCNKTHHSWKKINKTF